MIVKKWCKKEAWTITNLIVVCHPTLRYFTMPHEALYTPLPLHFSNGNHYICMNQRGVIAGCLSFVNLNFESDNPSNSYFWLSIAFGALSVLEEHTARFYENGHSYTLYRYLRDTCSCGIKYNLSLERMRKGLPRSYMVDLVQLHLPSSEPHNVIPTCRLLLYIWED